MDKLAFSATESAEILGVSRWMIYRLIDAGALAKVPHLGKRVQIARIELERFAACGLKEAS